MAAEQDRYSADDIKMEHIPQTNQPLVPAIDEHIGLVLHTPIQTTKAIRAPLAGHRGGHPTRLIDRKEEVATQEPEYATAHFDSRNGIPQRSIYTFLDFELERFDCERAVWLENLDFGKNRPMAAAIILSSIGALGTPDSFYSSFGLTCRSCVEAVNGVRIIAACFIIADDSITPSGFSIWGFLTPDYFFKLTEASVNILVRL
ncbi:uncharacterized protein FIBRA_01297 [Fibroporia radiculosa]|uniref:Uncharacterized protein n=1 Tax=Fibroporia radiculosa TaxID=599839 RepID=J4HT33_9APHY|nr:uncharacterized protein FIBRA_01297 [Fibroporia radiculosa]CCL99282.1 predicted protein [Fibroporia radiculosa]